VTDTPAERGPENPWERLRRRKVVQWALAYAAGAWALLQVLGFAADSFGWPALVKQLAMLGLAVGLPILLTLAWFHGERAQQRVTGKELGILTLLLLVGGGLLWWYANRPAEAPPAVASTTAATSSSATTDPRPSIAVLPFDNRSRLEDDAFFVDGIHDDILTQLSKISALRVISRSSVERFRESDLSVHQIAGQLGVTSILEGGVQRAGDRVRINVQLIDAASDAHLWAESYDRELSAANIFAIQSEVAAAIGDALKATLTPAEEARSKAAPTQDLQAWEAHQLGKQRMAIRTSAGLKDAERYFRKAIERDPTFALAYVGQADAVTQQVFYSGRAREPSFTLAEELVTQALALAPDLSEAFATSAWLAHQRSDYKRSEADFQRSIALNPNYSTAYHWYSLLLLDLGRANEAHRQIEIALTLDPISTILITSSAFVLASLGRFQDAFAQYGKAIEIDPMTPVPYAFVGDTYTRGLGRLDAAIPWYEKAASLDAGNPQWTSALGLLYLDLGDEDRARRWLDTALEHGGQYADAQEAAAVFALYRGDVVAYRLHASKLAALDARRIRLLRDDYIRRDDYKAARARYASANPDLLAMQAPDTNLPNILEAIDLALVLQHTGEGAHAKALLDRSEAFVRTIPKMGVYEYGIAAVQIDALRGEKREALAKLREAERAGWRYGWRYHRDFDPNLDSIRNEPEFKAVFADIERDMAEQRAALAARPKDAPLDLALTGT
jgi:TolB-like protein/Tfp pilus assembly protein PilF